MNETVVGGLPPPPGVTPNFVNPYSIQRYIILTAVIGLILTTLCVCMRIYIKARVVRSLGWDDCE